MSHNGFIRTSLAAFVVAAGLIASPAGPTAAAPAKDPVIIVGGMATGPITDAVYLPLQARLRSAGYTVEIWSMPDYGLGDIHANAARLNTFADALRARTSASKVDLVGHSMGGLVSRDYVKTLGGATEVDSLITMGTPNYGTVVASLANFFLLGNCLTITGCQQMTLGSSYLGSLNAGDDSIGTVRYTNLTTINDALVVPHTNGYLTASDGNIANVTIQKQCPLRIVGHVALATDGTTADGILDALRGETIKLNCWAV
ncbi:MAG: lipase family alpha/beta hydrolase [Acidimicrobiia bacterium]